MPRHFGAPRVVCHVPTAGRQHAFDGHEGRGDVGPTGVKLQPAFVDHLLCLEHEALFHLDAVLVALHLRKELLDDLVHAFTQAGLVDADVHDVVLLGDAPDRLGLGLEVGAFELLAVQDAELAASGARRSDHHERGGVSLVRGVVANPDGVVSVRAKP
ncbi:hypothetical protein D3C86_1623630 [compost metagenome]